MDSHVGNTYSWHPLFLLQKDPWGILLFQYRKRPCLRKQVDIFVAFISTYLCISIIQQLMALLQHFLDQLNVNSVFQTLGSKKVFFNPTYFHLLIQQIDPSPLEIDYTPDGLPLTIGIYEWCGGKPSGCMDVGGGNMDSNLCSATCH